MLTDHHLSSGVTIEIFHSVLLGYYGCLSGVRWNCSQNFQDLQNGFHGLGAESGYQTTVLRAADNMVIHSLRHGRPFYFSFLDEGSTK